MLGPVPGIYIYIYTMPGMPGARRPGNIYIYNARDARRPGKYKNLQCKIGRQKNIKYSRGFKNIQNLKKNEVSQTFQCFEFNILGFLTFQCFEFNILGF